MSHRVEHARAEDFLTTLSDSSVGLILTDPPYFRVKNLAWDKAWSDADRFIAWLGAIADEWARVLKPNGTLVCFAGANGAASKGATLAARVECMLGERFDVTASAVWVKADAHGNGTHSRHKYQVVDRGLARSYFPQTERAIVCAHHGADGVAKGEAGYIQKCDEVRGFVFEPLRAYLDGERERAGVTPQDVNAATGTCMAGHWFTRSQWALPTRRHYETMRALFNRPGGDHLRREYEDLRREYEDLRREYEDLRREYEDLRRPFDATAGAHHTDVWTYPTVPARKGKHPCEKPEAMARDLVAQCSRPGDVVLDTFCGSGVFLTAAAALGRIAWGCDADEWWAARTRADVLGASGQPAAPAVTKGDAPALVAPTGQLCMF